jgi:hypothetical protein
VSARRLAVALGLAAVALVAPGTAQALDECRGLDECLPVVGPWVVVPPAGAGGLATVEWELRCPLPGYVVGGVDSRVTDRGIDVSVRGESGSPVAPGVTTRRALVFTARSATRGGAATAFKPAIGCIPLEGGGGRAQTSSGARSSVVKPGAPFTREVAVARLVPGRTRTIAAMCPVGRRVVAAGHAVAFRTATPPTRALVSGVSTRQTVGSTSVRVAASLAAGVPRAVPVLVQVHAVCAKGAE